MKHLNNYQKVFAVFLVGLLFFWIGIRASGSTDGNINFLYSFLFGLMPLVGGLIGMVKSSIWGRLKSTLGKAIFFISLGLFLWGLGETIWSYYNFFRHVPAPYPSLADLGFAPSIFFWIVGVIFLSSASGALLFLKRSAKAKVFALVACIALVAVSYYLLIQVARKGVLVPQGETALKTVLDIAYPLGDLLAVIFALIIFSLSVKYLGGIYRTAIGFILAGLGAMYIGDFVFSYATTVGTYYNADWGDLILTIGLFMLTYGVLGFVTKPKLIPVAPDTPVAADTLAPSPNNEPPTEV
jgi:hypothetical protein